MDEEIRKTLAELVKWTKVKARIQLAGDFMLSFKEREIWWVSLGLNIGSEQNGKNENFERPVLVLRKFGQNMFWAIPMTSKKKNNDYFMAIKYIESHENSEGEMFTEEVDGTVILSQIRIISSKRIIRKMGILAEDQFRAVKERIKNFL